MAYSMLVIDGFYNNPDEVRAFALEQDFGVRGNYPGQRTTSFITKIIKEYIEKHISGIVGKVYMDVDIKDAYNGAYQYTTASDRSWIHSDASTSWAGVCYLTPNAPLSSGTGLFRHKSTGLITPPKLPDGSINQPMLDDMYNDSRDMTKWEMIDRIGNVYNRLVLYRGDIFHTSLDYFGRNINDGRLFQTFFFNTDY